MYAQSNTLLLSGVLENFRNKCTEIHELDPAHFLSAPGLAWQACLKKTIVELELLGNIDMLLMAEKGIRSGTCSAIHRYAKANNNYMKNYYKNIESSYLMNLDVINLYAWGMSQKLPVNGFKWAKRLSKFDEGFIKNCDENRSKEDILQVNVKYPKYLFNLYKDLLLLAERRKIKKCNKRLCNIHDKGSYVLHIRTLKQALNHGLIFKKCIE